jgi:hypothetical protein
MMLSGKGRLSRRPFCLRFFAAERFITHSSNKIDGTGKYREHRLTGFVVGVGNAIR